MKWFMKNCPMLNSLVINTALSSGAPITVMTQAGAFDLRRRVNAGVYLGIKKLPTREKLHYEGI